MDFKVIKKASGEIENKLNRNLKYNVVERASNEIAQEPAPTKPDYILPDSPMDYINRQKTLNNRGVIPAVNYNPDYAESAKVEEGLSTKRDAYDKQKKAYEDAQGKTFLEKTFNFAGGGDNLNPIQRIERDSYNEKRKAYFDDVEKASKYHASKRENKIKKNIYRAASAKDISDWYHSGKKGILSDTSIGQLAFPTLSGVYKKSKSEIFENLSDAEVNTIDYLLDNEGEDKANDYIEYLIPRLNKRTSQKTVEGAQKMANESPTKASALSFLTNIGRMQGFGDDVAAYYKGEELDPNSAGHQAGLFTDTARGTVAQNLKEATDNPIMNSINKATSYIGIDNVPEFLYNTANSAIDSAINVAISGGIGRGLGLKGTKLNEVTSLITSGIMGSQVAADAVTEAKEKGLSDADAITLGILRGATEGITEKYSIDNIFDNPNATLSKLIKNPLKRAFVSEGSEEVANNLINYVTNAVYYGDKNDLTQAYNKYLGEGQSKPEALANVLYDAVKENTSAFLAGGISGLGMSAAHNIINNSKISKVGKTIEKNGATEDVIDIAMGMDESTESHKKAQQIVDSGNMTTKEVGELAQTVSQELYEQRKEQISNEDNAVVDTINAEMRLNDAVSVSTDETPLSMAVGEKKHLNKAQQDELIKTGKAFGIPVVFENMAETMANRPDYKGGTLPDSYVDGDGVMHFDFSVRQPEKFLFKHELTHFTEDTKGYSDFTEAVRKSKAFENWLNAKVGSKNNIGANESMLRQMIIDSRKDTSPVTPDGAQLELIADFVGDMLFTDKGSGLDTLINSAEAKDKPKIIQWVTDFLRYLKSKLTNKNLSLEVARLESKYAKMARDVKNNVTPTLVKEAGVNIDEKTESANPQYSVATWKESDYVTNREKAAKELAETLGIDEAIALAYLKDIDSIARMISDDAVRLDYKAAEGKSSFVSNVEYGGSIDFSTLCKKRRLLTGTLSEIQKRLPNAALSADDYLKIRNMMIDAGLEVSCGLCYVEGSRASMGKFAKEFINRYQKQNPKWIPDMVDVNTPDGVEAMRINHPEAYAAYEHFWNNKGVLNEGEKNLFASQQKPKLYSARTSYKGEILEAFMGNKEAAKVEEKNRNGGLRMQSFSDFEIVHLIDCMQVITDMSRVGLAGQAYTKVPEFALALGRTGLKINLSVIAKGVDENGNLIFDDREGMPIETAKRIRDMYPENVGTILVVFNDQQLKAAMNNDVVDFIIPFHRSQWKKAMYDSLGLPKGTKDYTYQQNERYIKPVYYITRNNTQGKRKAKNYMPNEYWDFSKTGKENAEKYLKMCAENNKRPKFYKLLVNNGDGSYSLQPDGSTDGYWKLLIDFKMYDNNGKGSPQKPVKPDFNMEECQKMLNEYKGGHSQYPVAWNIVDKFSNEYMTDSVSQSVKKPAGTRKENRYDTLNFKASIPTKAEIKDKAEKEFKNSKVRDESGNLKEMYHGTSNFGFTIFDTYGSNFGLFGLGSYFTDNKDVADSYQKKGKGGFEGTYSVYLNIENPLDMDAKLNESEWLDAFDGDEYYLDDAETNEDAFKALKEYCIDNDMYKDEAEDYIRNAIEGMGYDGITHIGGGRYGNKDGTKHRVYIAFHPEQIKSSEPTRNNFGEPIPLEERFNTDSGDYRYSIPTDAKNIMNRYDEGKISKQERDEQLNKLWGEATDKYGTFNDKDEIPVPKQVEDNKNVNRFVRNIIKNGKLTNKEIQDISADVLVGNPSYTPVSDKEAQAYANRTIEKGESEEKWEEALNQGVVSKDNLALGEQMLADAIKAKDTQRIFELETQLCDLFTRAGQAVQAASMFKKMTGVGRVMTLQRAANTLNKSMKQKYGDKAPKVKLNEMIAKQLLSANTQEGLSVILDDALIDMAAQVPATFMDKLNAWRYFAMLSNIKTHIRNLVGNGVFVPAVRIKDVIGTGLEKVLIKDENLRTKVVAVDKKYKDFAEKDVLTKEAKEMLTGNKLDEKGKILQERRIFKTDTLEKPTKGNSALLEWEDFIFKSRHYRHALGSYLQARHIDLSKIDAKTLNQARTYAVNEAKKATYQDASVIAEWLNTIKTPKKWEGNDGAEITMKVLRMGVEGILPFKRTPINIIKRGIEYSPIELIKDLTYGLYEVKKGKMTMSDFCDGLASGLTGTGICAIGFMLAMAGLVKGGMGNDDEDYFEKLNGEQEYSVQIPEFTAFGKKWGNVSYTVDWAAPACLPFFIGVELANNNDKGITLKEIPDTMANVLEPIVNLSMLSGVQNTIDSVKFAKDNQTISGIITNTATSFGMQMYPAALGAMQRVADPVQRKWYTDKTTNVPESLYPFLNNISSKTPLSKLMPESVDEWGRTKTRGNAAERIATNFLSPGYGSRIDYDKADKELKRIYEATGERVFPKPAKKYIVVNKVKKDLSGKEWEKYAKLKGSISYDYIHKFINMRSYDKLTDAEKAKVITDLYKYADAKAKSQVSDYDVESAFKTASKWEKQGNSIVNFYISKALD